MKSNYSKNKLQTSNITLPEVSITWGDFIACWTLGWLGVHRFRQKQNKRGWLYLLTFGLLGFGWSIDTMVYLAKLTFISPMHPNLKKVFKTCFVGVILITILVPFFQTLYFQKNWYWFFTNIVISSSIFGTLTNLLLFVIMKIIDNLYNTFNFISQLYKSWKNRYVYPWMASEANFLLQKTGKLIINRKKIDFIALYKCLGISIKDVVDIISQLISLGLIKKSFIKIQLTDLCQDDFLFFCDYIRFVKSEKVADILLNDMIPQIQSIREIIQYKNFGTKQYQFLATLDNRTCSVCGQLDRKVFDISNAEIGKNFPPMHEGCRCTTTANISDEVLASMKRRARDPVTGKNYLIPANTTYQIWKQQQNSNNVQSSMINASADSLKPIETSLTLQKEPNQYQISPINCNHFDAISERDELFEEAGKFVIEKEKASIGMLQRAFKIGFNRAARIMDQLFEAGVVGEEDGTKPRKILMTMDEFQYLLDQLSEIERERINEQKDSSDNGNAMQTNPFDTDEVAITNNVSVDKQIIDDCDKMEGWEFENYCAGLLRMNGFEKVVVTSGSGDHGIDITATMMGAKYGFQCKRYTGPVGNKAVQEAYSGCTYYHLHVPVVITNSYFTEQAIEEAKTFGVLLWDRDKLLELILACNIEIK